MDRHVQRPITPTEGREAAHSRVAWAATPVLALTRYRLVTSSPGRFTPDTRQIGCRVRPKEFSWHFRRWNTDHPARRYTDRATAARTQKMCKRSGADGKSRKGGQAYAHDPRGLKQEVCLQGARARGLAHRSIPCQRDQRSAAELQFWRRKIEPRPRPATREHNAKGL
jgi:hypothetical protein